MNFNYLMNTPLAAAIERYLQTLADKDIHLDEETIKIENSLGRVCAQAVYAVNNNPHYNASAMDGIAVRAADTYPASDLRPLTLDPSRFGMIDTGDRIHDEYDAVIMMEDVIWDGGNAVLTSPAVIWQHIRQVGEDICAGDMIISSFTRIDAFTLAALAASGVREIKVLEKIKVCIIPTGDELVSLDKAPAEGEIPEFNSLMITAMLADPACSVITAGIVRDDRNALKQALQGALADNHMVLINAGSSAGRDDYTSQIIAGEGEVCFHGLAIKPGKPTILGICRNRAVIGIPGYPVSAAVIVMTVIKKISNHFLHALALPPDSDDRTTAVLSRRVVSGLKYEEFLRIRLNKTGETLTAVPVAGGAGVVTSLIKADAVARIPQDCEGLEAGASIQCRLLRNLDEIENTLVITGSHDPVIDEISDMMRRRYGRRVSSANTGSIGGIMAIKRGETHIAPVHLLDINDGSYNTSYIDSYIPEMKVTLVKGVKRLQGLIVPKGNPKKIHGIGDLADKIYVNRTRNAGTRILFDMLLQKEGIDPGDITGYNNEQLTHTAVAAAVKAGNADAGMGIYSAAARMDMDFIGLCEEDYDFIIPDEYLALPAVMEFLEVIRSGEFWERTAAMGGYDKPDVR
ncbi:MAG: molybdopterin biosynthesis protein [Saccharofermentanales bacterium]